METKIIGTIMGLIYTAVIVAGIASHIAVAAVAFDSALRDEVEASAVTNSGGIEFRMAEGYEVPHCTAIAAKVAMAHQGYSLNAAKIAAATCLPGTDCRKLGRYMHNAADVALEQSGDDNLQRHLSRATTIEDLVSEMISHGATAAIVSVDVPQYYHAVAVVIEGDGSWRVIDAAMTTTMIYGGTDYAKINAWSGELRKGQNWFFTRS